MAAVLKGTWCADEPVDDVPVLGMVLAFQFFDDRGLPGGLEYGVAVGVDSQRECEGFEDVPREHRK